MFAGHIASAVARWGRLSQKPGRVLVGLALTLASGACFSPPGDVVLNTETGEPVLLEDIDPILADPDLTEDEKRQELIELGVPEELIDTLLRAS